MKILLHNRVVGEVVSITDCKSCKDQTPYVALNNKVFDVKWLNPEMEKYAYEMALTFNQRDVIDARIFPYRISDFIRDMHSGFGLKIIKVNDNILLGEVKMESELPQKERRKKKKK